LYKLIGDELREVQCIDVGAIVLDATFDNKSNLWIATIDSVKVFFPQKEPGGISFHFLLLCAILLRFGYLSILLS
jgi:hypothetical protein